MKKVAILQSNYIPWKGYFDMIASVDEFIFYDDMQYTRRDWRNRNQIKTLDGRKWLTVPVKVKGKYFQKIRDTEIDGVNWADVHWKTLALTYRHAPFFDEVAKIIEPIYGLRKYTYLSELNQTLIRVICSYLGIQTKISNSWDYNLIDGKTERLLDLCLQAGGTEYLSGPSAKNYIEEHLFLERGIRLSWFDYSSYPVYKQLYGEFIHEVTILDLLFNCGKDSSKFMKFSSASIKFSEKEK